MPLATNNDHMTTLMFVGRNGNAEAGLHANDAVRCHESLEAPATPMFENNADRYAPPDPYGQFYAR